MIDGWGISCEITLIWMSLYFTGVSIDWGNGLVQQAITWANFDPDLCRHMVSLGHNELTWTNSLAPVRSGFDFKNEIFNPVYRLVS